MPAKKKSIRSTRIVGRDQIISGGDRSVVIAGDVSHSIIATGDSKRVTVSKFEPVYKQMEERLSLPAEDKSDLKTELESFEAEDKKGPEANQGFLAQRLRNVKRIAPDILEVALTTIGSPAAGFGVIAKKVADKMKAEADSSK